MKIINEKGRLFGIINVVDLLILLIIAAFASSLILRRVSTNAYLSAAAPKEVKMSEETPVFVKNISNAGNGFSIDFFKKRDENYREAFFAEVWDLHFTNSTTPLFKVPLPPFVRDRDFDPHVSGRVVDFLIFYFGTWKPEDPNAQPDENLEWWMGDMRDQFFHWLTRYRQDPTTR